MYGCAGAVLAWQAVHTERCALKKGPTVEGDDVQAEAAEFAHCQGALPAEVVLLTRGAATISQFQPLLEWFITPHLSPANASVRVALASRVVMLGPTTQLPVGAQHDAALEADLLNMEQAAALLRDLQHAHVGVTGPSRQVLLLEQRESLWPLLIAQQPHRCQEGEKEEEEQGEGQQQLGEVEYADWMQMGQSCLIVLNRFSDMHAVAARILHCVLQDEPEAVHIAATCTRSAAAMLARFHAAVDAAPALPLPPTVCAAAEAATAAYEAAARLQQGGSSVADEALGRSREAWQLAHVLLHHPDFGGEPVFPAEHSLAVLLSLGMPATLVVVQLLAKEWRELKKRQRGEEKGFKAENGD